MYNILIVDDEEPVLESYSHMISKREDMMLGAMARNGVEALSIVHSTHPDIVVMDIGMPGLDGLETIEEMQKLYPEILYIVSTAYERFDVAKRAIPLGLFRYLVKPVSRKTFTETLDAAKVELDVKQKSVIAHLDNLKRATDAQAWEERKFLSSLTWKKLSDSEWEYYRETFHIVSDSAMICIVSARTWDDCHACYDSIVKKLGYKFLVLSMEYLGRLILFISGAESEQTLKDVLSETVNASSPEGIEVALGFGSIQTHEGFLESFQQALACVDAGFYDVEALKQERALLLELRKSLRAMEDLKQVNIHFNLLCDAYLLKNSFAVAKGKLIMAFTLLFEDLEVMLPEEERGKDTFDYIKDIDALTNREELDLWASRILGYLQDRLQFYHFEHQPPHLRKAVSHIEQNFHKPLQLASVAESCNVSPSYVSRLFSEHMQCSFIDYLTSVRIQHAKLLMRTTDKPVKEIAFDVGYQDPNYFSKIFKKVCGVSPSAFLQGKESEHD